MSEVHPFRILITGSRSWWDAGTIVDALMEYLGAPNVVLVSGHCPIGADRIAEAFADQVGWTIEEHEVTPNQWELFGKAAGPMRNAHMVSLGADICLAFIKNDSPGASGTAAMAQDAGIKTLIFEERNDTVKEHPYEPRQVSEGDPWLNLAGQPMAHEIQR